jgi:hypothetical protein
LLDIKAYLKHNSDIWREARRQSRVVRLPEEKQEVFSGLWSCEVVK